MPLDTLQTKGNGVAEKSRADDPLAVEKVSLNTKTQTSDNVTRNIVDTRLYKLTSDEKAECISFLDQHIDIDVPPCNQANETIP